MSDSCVIVAIPDETSQFWKASSEKVPHLTLLFLGELDDSIDQRQIIEFVEHVASVTPPEYLAFDRRGVLGSENADVVFVKKSQYGMARISNLRSALLTNADIRRAYDSAEQYPSWMPHVTLGYPDKPARESEDYIPWDNFGSYFSKIAVWFGDSEGPTFDLTTNEGSEVAEISYADKAESFLEHFGVKGMRWGIRKRREPVEATAAQKKPGTKVVGSGGKNLPAHDDAVKVAVSKQKAKASTTDALSTKELQELVNRMNLEQNYARLTGASNQTSVQRGKKFLGEFFGEVGSDVAKGIENDPTIQKNLKDILSSVG